MVNKNIIILLVFLILQYSNDRSTSKCNTNKGELLLFIHHLISAYVYLGGFLFDPLYHLIFITIIIIRWLTNNNRCFITPLTNKYCGHPENYRFRDILYFTDISTLFPNVLYVILIFYILYDCYMIYKKYNKH